MTPPESIKIENASLLRDILQAARYYLGRRWVLVTIVGVVLIGGLVFNWGWLVAIGVAPILVTLLPCAVMCGLGLCAHKMMGASGTSSASHSGKTESAKKRAPAGAPRTPAERP